MKIFLQESRKQHENKIKDLTEHKIEDDKDF